LIELGVLSSGASIDDYEALSKDFRESTWFFAQHPILWVLPGWIFFKVWADHADEIATAYGGSAALKSDFTRTNKRTPKGAFDDAVKSTLRYLKNNYFDGARQV
jgi:hypothetical protein